MNLKEKREKSLSINNYVSSQGEHEDQNKRARTTNYSFDLHSILLKSIKGAESRIEKSKVYSKADHILKRQIEQTFKTNQPTSNIKINRLEGRPYSGVETATHKSKRSNSKGDYSSQTTKNPTSVQIQAKMREFEQKSSLREKINNSKRAETSANRYSTTPHKPSPSISHTSKHPVRTSEGPSLYTDLKHRTDRNSSNERSKLESRIRSRISSERETSAHRKHKSSIEKTSFIDEALKKNSMIRAQIERRNKKSADYSYMGERPRGSETQWLQYLERKLKGNSRGI